MVSDLVQQNFKKSVRVPPVVGSGEIVRKARKALPPAPAGLSFELTREVEFIDGQHDIFDVLAHHAQERRILARSIGATIALLKRSSLMLQEAEDQIAAQNRKLEKLEAANLTDEVSGLLNRRGFIQVFAREVARTTRGANEGGLLVMFNLENLSMIRKNHGDEAAKKAVELLSRTLEAEIRRTDYAARLMDDEFVLLFTDATMEETLGRLQNMALRLNKISVVWEGTEINLNLSLGLKSFGPRDNPQDIFAAACSDLQRNRKGASAAPR